MRDEEDKQNEEIVTTFVVEKRKMKDGIKKKYIALSKPTFDNQCFWFQ
jgi:hypothetical protein